MTWRNGFAASPMRCELSIESKEENHGQLKMRPDTVNRFMTVGAFARIDKQQIDPNLVKATKAA